MKQKSFNLTIFDNTEKDKGRYVNILLAIANKNVVIHILITEIKINYLLTIFGLLADNWILIFYEISFL